MDPPKRIVIPLHKLGEFVARLEEECRNPTTANGVRTVYEVLLTCLFCGLRYGECRLLQWRHVDLDLGLLTIVSENAKNRSEHPVPFSDYIKRRFEALENARNPSCPYVFPSPHWEEGFKPIGRFWSLTHAFAQNIGIPFTPHAARRTFASIGNYLGLPFLTLKRLINHHYQGGITGGYVVQGFDPLQNRKHFQAIADFILDKRDEFLGVEKDPERIKLEQLKAFMVSVGLSPKEVLNWAHLNRMKPIPNQCMDLGPKKGELPRIQP